MIMMQPSGRAIQSQDGWFDYSLLHGDIRLVKLERGEGSDPIRCDMFDVEFITAPVYVALSYEWGRIGENSTIWINEGRRKIGRGLFHALLHLRRLDEDVIIWVDALCINQQNLRERNHQVQLMGEIYRKANEVAVWLGLPSDDSDKAMRQFRSISNQITLGEPVGRPMNDIEAVVAWGRRSYWSRMWVIQEIQLARDLSVYCGKEHISWSDFSRTRQWVLGWAKPFGLERELYYEMTLSLPARMDEMRIVENRGRGDRLIDWLEMFEKSLCTDPKDKVYAIVGVARDCQKGELDVDYSKSMSEVFLDLLKHYMQRDVNSPGPSTTDTASLLFLCRCLFEWLLMDSSGPKDELKEEVWVLGTFCGSIAILGPEYHVSPTRTRQLQVGHHNKPVSISSKRLAAVSAFNSGKSSASFADEATVHNGILDAIVGRLFPKAKTSRSPVGNTTVEFETQLLPLGNGHWSVPGELVEKTVGLRTTITSQGETILVPPSTHYDDMICILPGCDIALIFRKFNQWTLEGIGVYSRASFMSPPAPADAINVFLDIHALQKITLAAEFAPAYQLGATWWHQQ